MRTYDLVLVRSDQGDGGWSLHPPGSTDKEIASGDAPVLLSGPSAWNETQGEWISPVQADYDKARVALRTQTEAK